MKASAWLVVKADRNPYSPDRIRAVRITQIRQNRPSLGPDELAVKATLEVDTDLFTKPIYTVEAAIPAGAVLLGPALEIDPLPESENGL